MIQPKLGFLSVTCPTHKEAINENGENWVDIENLKKIEDGLEKNNLKLVKADSLW
ncbi:MAG: hypothetical protein WA097_04155 [Candidatus Hydromicrobium sp.]